MSFNGSSPLNSLTEFDIYTSFAASLIISSPGNLRYYGHNVGLYDSAVAASTLSGTAVDGSYVAISCYGQDVPSPDLYYAAPGFYDPATVGPNPHFLQLLFPVDQGVLTTGYFAANTGSGVQYVALTNTGGFDTTQPFEVAIGITGNIATAYFFDGLVWHAWASADVSSIFNPALLTSYVAGIFFLDYSNSNYQYVDSFTWGPQAALTTTAVVPNVVGLSDSAAQIALVTAGCTVGAITATPNTAPVGQVLSQSIPGGTVVTGGTAIDLTESQGELVPNLTNLSESVARAVLADAGFTVGAISTAPSVLIIPGNVTTQSPAPGAYASAGSPVSFTLSAGREAVAVPDLIGLTEPNAVLALTSVGLTPGAISFAPSTTVPAGIVIAQNPGPGIPNPIYLAPYSIVGFVVSSGPPIAGSAFDFESTVISQYANSPTLLQLVSNMNQYIDQTANFANFYTYVWNVLTARGFGLDIWGKIVNVSRLLRIPNTTLYVGFDNSATPPADWQNFGSDQPGGAGVGQFYTGYNATQAYLLPDDAYRQLILAKAFANICATTAPAINQLLQNLYGKGAAWVLNAGVMAISYNFNFRPSDIQTAILEQSNVIPTPPGVSVAIVTP